MTTVFEVGIVSVFDPGLNSLAARLVTQAMLAVTLVGVAFALTAEEAGIAPPEALGLRRPAPASARPGSPPRRATSVHRVRGRLLRASLHPHQKDITRDLGFGHGGFGTVAAGVLIVVAAPVSEEIFFRGFIFGGLRNRLSFPWRP